MPYVIGPFKDILLHKCCKKKYQRGHPSRKLKLEQKYGLMLNTSFTVLSFCYEMPMLLSAAAISFCFQYFLDRLLITYWYDEYPIHSDSLDAFVLRVFKYAPSIMIIFTSMIIYQSYCNFSNDPPLINYTNQLLVCQKMWAVPWLLLVFGILLFILSLSIDIYRRLYEGNITRFEKIFAEEQEYFSRMSLLDVKRWLLLETYNREVLGFKSIDDDSFQNLKEAKGNPSNYSNEPPNYIILCNESYCRKLSYVPIHSRDGQIQT